MEIYEPRNSAEVNEQLFKSFASMVLNVTTETKERSIRITSTFLTDDARIVRGYAEGNEYCQVIIYNDGDLRADFRLIDENTITGEV